MLKTFLMRMETTSYRTFISKYNIKTNFLEYYKVVSALKLFKQKCPPEPNSPSKTRTLAQMLLASERVCKTVYKLVLGKKATAPVKSQEKWLPKENIFGNVNVNWEKNILPPFSMYD